jgi:poly(3-hydroxyalkanoate) synthetase
MLAAQAPTLSHLALHSQLESWRVSAEALGDWWSGALGRGATPLDLAGDLTRWGETMSVRARPDWSSPNEVVLTTSVARLRDFTRAGAPPVVSTLVIPPQAGHDSCIVDYSAEQSQMRAIIDAGLARAFSLDWIGATQETKNASIDDYLGAVHAAVEHIGEPVNLIGDCQGGWLAMIYAAFHPELVNTLTIAGAPIDFHAGEPIIHRWVQALSPGGSMAFYRALVAAAGGVLPGEAMLAGFIVIKPENEISRQLALLTNVRKPEQVERYRTFEGWYKHMQAIPGAFYLWIVEELFLHNRLIRGELEVGGEPVDLARIEAPLNLLAGAGDHITPPEQVYFDADAVATPPARIAKFLSSGGHLGLFMGHEALREHWPPLLAGVLRRSRRRVRPSRDSPSDSAALRRPGTRASVSPLTSPSRR